MTKLIEALIAVSFRDSKSKKTVENR